jgi:recombination protein RecT
MPGATEILKQQAGLVKKPASIMEQLEAMKPQIALALPRHLTPERMVRIAITCMRTNPRLTQCVPETVLASIMIASQLGLEPGVMGQSFLVPYKNKRGEFICQLIPGWMGLVDLVNRSEKASVTTGAVYRGDIFDWQLGTEPFLRHKPCGSKEHMTHVYSIGRIKNSDWPIIEVWTTEQIIEHRNKLNKVGSDHYSYTWMEQYARKVPLMQVIKYLPKSIEMATAISLDNAAETGGTEINIKDVPTILEGVSIEQQQEPEFEDARAMADTAKQKTNGKDKQAVPDMCNSCGKVGGHEPDCKYVAAQFDKEVAATKTVAAETKQPAAEAKPAAEVKPTTPRHEYILKKFDKGKQRKTGNEYLVLHVTTVGKDAVDGKLYVWHDHLKPLFAGLPAEKQWPIIVETKQQKADNNQPYFAVEHVFKIGDVEFVDDKPVTALLQTSLSDEDMF